MSPTDIFDDVINAPIGATVSLGKEQYRLGPSGWMNMSAVLPEYSDPQQLRQAAEGRRQMGYQDLNRRLSADVTEIATGPGTIQTQQQAIQQRQARFLRDQADMNVQLDRDAYAEQQARTREAGIARVANQGIDAAALKQKRAGMEAHRREQQAIVDAARPAPLTPGPAGANPDDARRASWSQQAREQASHRKSDWEASKLGDVRVGDAGAKFRKTALGWAEEPQHDVISAMAANKQRDIAATQQQIQEQNSREVDAAFKRSGSQYGRVLVGKTVHERRSPNVDPRYRVNGQMR